MRHRPQAPGLDGVLLVDKTVGPTSHDVVARMRRVLGQQRIGHTGTLDPRASGLLVLVLGRATKLAALLTAAEKTYDARVRLGVRTTTDDAEGEPMGPHAPVTASADAMQAALDRFRGVISQVPPAHSAKKVGGQRAYVLARRDAPVTLAPSTVTVHQLDWLGLEGDEVLLRVTASSGFYVRSLARDLGEVLGCGGHLAALRRTRVGMFSVDQAISVELAEQPDSNVAARVIPPAAALPHLGWVTVTEAGGRRVQQGNFIGPAYIADQACDERSSDPVRVLDGAGRLLALARWEGAALHPLAVLG